MGKIARLLLSRKPIEGEREYRPSEEFNKNYDPRARSGLKVRNEDNHKERVDNRKIQNAEVIEEQPRRPEYRRPDVRRYEGRSSDRRDERRDDRRFDERRKTGGDYMERRQSRDSYKNDRGNRTRRGAEEECSVPQFENRRRRR